MKLTECGKNSALRVNEDIEDNEEIAKTCSAAFNHINEPCKLCEPCCFKTDR